MIRFDWLTASRREPVPESANVVTVTVVPPVPPVAIEPKPTAPSNASADTVGDNSAVTRTAMEKYMVNRKVARPTSDFELNETRWLYKFRLFHQRKLSLKPFCIHIRRYRIGNGVNQSGTRAGESVLLRMRRRRIPPIPETWR